MIKRTKNLHLNKLPQKHSFLGRERVNLFACTYLSLKASPSPAETSIKLEGGLGQRVELGQGQAESPGRVEGRTGPHEHRHSGPLHRDGLGECPQLHLLLSSSSLPWCAKFLRGL